jgi:hypothetical protein
MTLVFLLILQSLPAADVLLAGAGLTPDEVRTVQSGQIVARADVVDRIDVVSAGAFKARVTPERFWQCARDPRCLRESGDLLQSGAVSAPPSPADFAALRLDARQVEALPRCQVGRCGFRLPAEAITRVRSELDGKTVAVSATAERVIREVLAEIAARYLAQGNRGLPTYHDRPAPVAAAARLEELLQRPWPLLEAAPGLRRFLLEFPGARPPELEDGLYWFAERFYRRKLIAVHQGARMAVAERGREAVFAASKQVYANHYLYAAAELAVLVREPSRAEGYLIWSSRVRTDIRPGGFTWLERLLLRRLARGRLEDHLARLRRSLAAA